MNWDKMNRDPINKAGTLVRVTARGFIRTDKRTGRKKGTPSRPGSPPKSHQSGSLPPFKMIFNVPDGVARQVVGMVGFGGEPIPGLTEYGGVASRRVFLNKKTFRRGRKRRNPTVRKNVKYPPRPFIRPALKKVQSRLPSMWDGCFTKVAH